MDNFMILAKMKKKLKERIIWFLNIVEKYNLYFKRSKCNFDMEEISILEVVVGWGQVQMKNNKIKAVKQ